MVVLLLITVLLRSYINTIEGRRDIDSGSSFALMAARLAISSMAVSPAGGIQPLKEALHQASYSSGP